MKIREQELIVYRNFEEYEAMPLHDMAWLMGAGQRGEEDCGQRANVMYRCMYSLLELAGNYGFYGNLWHCYLAHLLVNNENSYSRACEVRGAVEGSINQAVLHDIVIFKELFDFDFSDLVRELHIDGFDLITNYVSSDSESKVYNSRIRERICSLAVKFTKDHTPEEMKDTLTEFYRDYGVGKFGLHKAFRVVHDERGVQIVPIPRIAHVRLDDLVGYEIPKGKLIANTEAFVKGKKANNCLLFGDAGTGKSSSIKAIANEYYEKGLRVIEVYKHQFQDLHDVIAQVKNRNYKFIIYMDDLSFEEYEIEYKFLKALIEGGVETKPDNILIYATSNRRHIIKETWNDRNDIETEKGMHRSDTMEEKLSLVNRFGVTINYSKPSQKEYFQIVIALARKQGITLSDEELCKEANKWELSHGGISGRTAQQFINYLDGKVEEK